MFQFDKSIDLAFMESMYENDYSYIEQIFSLTLSNYDTDAKSLSEKFLGSDLKGLQKAIHKMKSTFGFTGMLALQNNCQEMETKCAFVSSVSEIKEDIEKLLNSINNHKLILQHEYTRLNKFNNQAS